MAYIGWPSNVNKDILDSTNITIGNDAVIEDNMASGRKNSRLKSSNVPDVYQAQMDFDWHIKDENGQTEKDRFLNWYKYKHCYGVNPVQFPKIILGTEDTPQVMAYYKISGGATGQKHGDCERFNLIFTEVFVGTINLPSITATIDHITVYKDRLEVIFTECLDEDPLITDFSVSAIKDAAPYTPSIDRYEFDGSRTEIIKFNADLTSGLYSFSVTYKGVSKTDSINITGD